MDIVAILEEYEKEMQEDLYLDEMNAKEKSMRLGIIWQKWANRISKHKIKLRDLIDQKEERMDVLLGNIKLPVAVTVAKKNKSLETDESIKKINKEIRKQEDIIEYLEMSYKNLDSLGWNVKSLIELIKMENY